MTTMKEVAACFDSETWQTAREAGATSLPNYGMRIGDAYARKLLDRRPLPPHDPRRSVSSARWEYRRAQ